MKTLQLGSSKVGGDSSSSSTIPLKGARGSSSSSKTHSHGARSSSSNSRTTTHGAGDHSSFRMIGLKYARRSSSDRKIHINNVVGSSSNGMIGLKAAGESSTKKRIHSRESSSSNKIHLKCAGESSSSKTPLLGASESTSRNITHLNGAKISSSNSIKHPSGGGKFSSKSVMPYTSAIDFSSHNTIRIKAPGNSFSNRVISSKAARESSSSKRIHVGNFMCAICMEPRLLSESFSASGCFHLYCVSCMKRYLVSKIQEKASCIRCPDPSCTSGTFKPEKCRKILTPKVFEQWCKVLCEAVVLDSKRIYCPFKDCSAPLMNDKGHCIIRESECPHCNRLFCVQCKVPWHVGISCEEFQKLNGNKDDVKLLELAKHKKWQRCPICKFFVERTEGCRAMKCRCGSLFCYGCGKPMRWDNYCATCG